MGLVLASEQDFEPLTGQRIPCVQDDEIILAIKALNAVSGRWVGLYDNNLLWSLESDATGVVAETEPGAPRHGFTATPNPSRGVVDLAAWGLYDGSWKVALYDVTGRRVVTRSMTVESGHGSTAWNLGLSPGIYFAVLTSPDGHREATAKLVIVK